MGSDIRSQTESVRLSRLERTKPPAWYAFWRGLSLLWTRLESRPAFVFILVSIVFGSAIGVAVPPLRGPDEIAHFLRIYSYARGDVVPTVEVDGRKGIFIEGGLYTQLSFFKDAGERFALNREQGLRYGEIMKEYPPPGRKLNSEGQPTKFMPFAGTEGYNPVAYAPYVLAAVTGNLLGLEFPNMLLLMRFLGLATFTAVAAYAIKVTPTLKWAFVLIAMLPVSVYNRSVLSADGAALAYAMVITALCIGAVQRAGRSLGTLVLDDTLLAQQAATDRVCAVGADSMSDHETAGAVPKLGGCRGSQLHFVAAMGVSSIRRHSGMAPF